MPERSRYAHLREAQCCTRCGRQSPTPLCNACRERQRADNARSYAKYKYARQARRALPHEQWIAHCGRWHRLDALPWQCPQCAWELATIASSIPPSMQDGSQGHEDGPYLGDHP